MSSPNEIVEAHVEKRSPSTLLGALLLNQIIANDYSAVFTLTDILYTGVTKFDLGFTVNEVDHTQYSIDDPSSLHRDLITRAIQSANSYIASKVDARQTPSLASLFNYKDAAIISSSNLGELLGFRVLKFQKKKNKVTLKLNMDIEHAAIAVTAAPSQTNTTSSSSTAVVAAPSAASTPAQPSTRTPNPIQTASEGIVLTILEDILASGVNLDDLKRGYDLYRNNDSKSSHNDPENTDLQQFETIYKKLVNAIRPGVTNVANVAYTNGVQSMQRYNRD